MAEASSSNVSYYGYPQQNPQPQPQLQQNQPKKPDWVPFIPLPPFFQRGAAVPPTPYYPPPGAAAAPVPHPAWAPPPTSAPYPAMPPPPVVGPHAPNSTGVQDAYKTVPCENINTTGTCPYGEKCRFAHSPEELRIPTQQDTFKTVLCAHFQSTGTCSYGHKCRFAHSEAELRQPGAMPMQPQMSTAARPRQNPNYKTVLCENFERDGECKYGMRCQFIHRTVPAHVSKIRELESKLLEETTKRQLAEKHASAAKAADTPNDMSERLLAAETAANKLKEELEKMKEGAVESAETAQQSRMKMMLEQEKMARKRALEGVLNLTSGNNLEPASKRVKEYEGNEEQQKRITELEAALRAKEEEAKKNQEMSSALTGFKVEVEMMIQKSDESTCKLFSTIDPLMEPFVFRFDNGKAMLVEATENGSDNAKGPSTRFAEEIKELEEGKKSIPAFLAAVTLKLERETQENAAMGGGEKSYA